MASFNSPQLCHYFVELNCVSSRSFQRDVRQLLQLVSLLRHTHLCAPSLRESRSCRTVALGRCCSRSRLVLPMAWALITINAPASETSPAVISRKLCARFSWSADGTSSIALRALLLPSRRLLLVPAALEPAGFTILTTRNAESGARRLAALIAGNIFHTRGATVRPTRARRLAP